MDLVKDVYFAADHRPSFAYGLQHSFAAGISMYGGRQPVDAAATARDSINYAVWLNVFSPRLVETYGRETLLSAPTWHVDEFGDGSVLVVSTPNPTYPGETGAIDDHLGIEPPAELDGCTY